MDDCEGYENDEGDRKTEDRTYEFTELFLTLQSTPLSVLPPLLIGGLINGRADQWEGTLSPVHKNWIYA